MADPGIMMAFNEAAGGNSSGALTFIDAILAERPDLRQQPTYVPPQGEMGHTLFVGNEVFKGPNNEVMASFYGLEPQILRAMAGKGLPAPQVTCEGKGAMFFGMTRLPGVPLESCLDKLTAAEKKSIAASIGTFCADMAAAVAPAVADEMGAVVTPLTAESMTEALADPAVAKALGANYQAIRRQVSGYQDKPQVFMHGDLHPGNILIDPVTKKMTGVIDFGCARLTSPAEGFAELARSFPAAMADDVLEAFSQRQEEPVTREDINRRACAHAVKNLHSNSAAAYAEAAVNALRLLAMEVAPQMRLS